MPAAGHGYAYEKLKRKVGDYATAAAAVVLTMSGGKVATCAIGLTNLSETPLLADEAAQRRDRHQPRRGGAEEGGGRGREASCRRPPMRAARSNTASMSAASW